ncbi:MAG: hypothetical protein PHS64_08150, partial [Candidatus Omnitrophica bacterium]|nr:hypothetical protein [Candidatus Omnitrophota bacterium]
MKKNKIFGAAMQENWQVWQAGIRRVKAQSYQARLESKQAEKIELYLPMLRANNYNPELTAGAFQNAGRQVSARSVAVFVGWYKKENEAFRKEMEPHEKEWQARKKGMISQWKGTYNKKRRAARNAVTLAKQAAVRQAGYDLDKAVEILRSQKISAKPLGLQQSIGRWTRNDEQYRKEIQEHKPGWLKESVEKRERKQRLPVKSTGPAAKTQKPAAEQAHARLKAVIRDAGYKRGIAEEAAIRKHVVRNRRSFGQLLRQVCAKDPAFMQELSAHSWQDSKASAKPKHKVKKYEPAVEEEIPVPPTRPLEERAKEAIQAVLDKRLQKRSSIDSVTMLEILREISPGITVGQAVAWTDEVIAENNKIDYSPIWRSIKRQTATRPQPPAQVLSGPGHDTKTVSFSGTNQKERAPPLTAGWARLLSEGHKDEVRMAGILLRKEWNKTEINATTLIDASPFGAILFKKDPRFLQNFSDLLQHHGIRLIVKHDKDRWHVNADERTSLTSSIPAMFTKKEPTTDQEFFALLKEICRAHKIIDQEGFLEEFASFERISALYPEVTITFAWLKNRPSSGLNARSWDETFLLYAAQEIGLESTMRRIVFVMDETEKAGFKVEEALLETINTGDMKFDTLKGLRRYLTGLRSENSEFGKKWAEQEQREEEERKRARDALQATLKRQEEEKRRLQKEKAEQADAAAQRRLRIKEVLYSEGALRVAIQIKNSGNVVTNHSLAEALTVSLRNEGMDIRISEKDILDSVGNVRVLFRGHPELFRKDKHVPSSPERENEIKTAIKDILQPRRISGEQIATNDLYTTVKRITNYPGTHEAFNKLLKAVFKEIPGLQFALTDVSDDTRSHLPYRMKDRRQEIPGDAAAGLNKPTFNECCLV